VTSAGVLAVIMAGGEGARLRPLTCDRPKPMVPVKNRPLLDYAFDLLRGHGLKRAVLTLHYLPQAILDHLVTAAPGLTLDYTVEERPLGTAGGVRRAVEQVGHDGTVLVLSGDALTDLDLGALISFHRQAGAVATLALARVADPTPYGAVLTDQRGAITRFIEKPGPADACSEWVNTGIYVLEPAVLGRVPAGRPFDFSQDLFPRLLREGEPLYAQRSTCYWCDVGTLGQYLAANWDALAGRVRAVEAAGGAPRGTGAGGAEAGAGVDPGATVDAAATVVPPVAVAAGAALLRGARVGPFAVVGPDAVVGEDASVKRAVLWEGARVGPRAEVRGAVIGAGAVLGRRARVFQGAVVGDRTRVGALATIRPRARVWPGKEVAGGATVDDAVVWGAGSPPAAVAGSALRGAFNAELTPEFLARLGAALASTLDPGAPVVVGGDALAASQALRAALSGGLCASGARVLDVGRVAAPVARHAAWSLLAPAAAHVRGDARTGELLVELLGPAATALDRARERKLDAAIAGGDFRRPPAGKAGAVEYVAAAKEAYVSWLLRDAAGRARIWRRGFHVVGVYDHANLGDLLELLASELGLTVLDGAERGGDRGGGRGDGRGDERAGWSPAADVPAAALAEALGRGGAEFAFKLEPNAEDLALVLSDGRELGRAGLAVLAAHAAAMAARPGAGVPLPPDAPQAAALAVVAAGRRPFPASPTARAADDGIARLVLILGYLAEARVTLVEAAAALPPAHVRELTVKCPVRAKAAVMRHLAERRAAAGSRVRFGGGLRVFERDGTALLLPDPHRPAVRVVAEAASWEIAAELADFFARQIRGAAHEAARHARSEDD
jgi:mannose-1-phosphate guanylyltransferase/phosphomannomutase